MRIARWILVGVGILTVFGLVARFLVGRKKTDETFELTQTGQQAA